MLLRTMPVQPMWVAAHVVNRKRDRRVGRGITGAVLCGR
jgi:hypothetical protein